MARRALTLDLHGQEPRPSPSIVSWSLRRLSDASIAYACIPWSHVLMGHNATRVAPEPPCQLCHCMRPAMKNTVHVLMSWHMTVLTGACVRIVGARWQAGASRDERRKPCRGLGRR